jgi:predicted nucleotidyltransferase component of viral defense system
MSAPSRAEWEEVARRFGVEIAQVRRDHLISHVLAAISAAIPPHEVIFVGGTALARTHLPEGRLSEDIDLIVTAERSVVAARIEVAVRSGLARSHGRTTWRPALTATRDAEPAVLVAADGTAIQVQLLPATGYPAWPTQIVSVHQRYTDAPPARLRVPTTDAFVAAKLSAWMDRRTARDLFDLAALAQANLIGPGAVSIFARHGPTSRPLPSSVFDLEVDEANWQRSLGHQTRLQLTAHEALAVLRTAWERAAANRA